MLLCALQEETMSDIDVCISFNGTTLEKRKLSGGNVL